LNSFLTKPHFNNNNKNNQKEYPPQPSQNPQQHPIIINHCRTAPKTQIKANRVKSNQQTIASPPVQQQMKQKKQNYTINNSIKPINKKKRILHKQRKKETNNK
jgi:hypothetical protein